MKFVKNKNLINSAPLLFVVLLTLCLASVRPADAFTKKLGEVEVDCDLTLTYAGGWRVADQNSTLLKNVNGDDGNRNFEKWDMINNKFTIIADVDFRYKNQGFFFRPRAYYDSIYDKKTANDSPGTWNGDPNDFGNFGKECQDDHRDTTEVLDWFYYNNFYVGKMPITFRIGQQVVSWGEGLYVANGISSAMVPVDATAANSPGVTLKEIYLPVESVYGSIGLTPNLTLVGYYQWEWQKTRIDEQGAYFSTLDILDDSPSNYLTSTGDILATRGEDDEPSDSGQFGVGVRYVTEKLNATEFGLFFINYHNKGPTLVFAGDQYYWTYKENIKLYAGKISTVLFGHNVACELTYRDGLPLSTVEGTQEGAVGQIQISDVQIWGPGPMWDSLSTTFEIGFSRVFDLDADLISSFDESSWGGGIGLSFTWYQVFPYTDFNLAPSYQFRPDGTSPIGTFTEGAESFGVKFNFTYAQRLKYSFGYAKFLGDASENSKCDRDNVSATITYTF